MTTAARRELGEETGLLELPGHLEQLATYGSPERDPEGPGDQRGLPGPGSRSPGSVCRKRRRRRQLETGRRARRRRLAFDHGRILADGVERARAKLEYTPLAAAFCAETFTIAELRRIYEAVWGVQLDPRNFHRKVTTTRGSSCLQAKARPETGAGPPSSTGRESAVLHPPLMRPANSLSVRLT